MPFKHVLIERYRSYSPAGVDISPVLIVVEMRTGIPAVTVCVSQLGKRPDLA